MKDKNIFDILENAEYNSMERLIEKCPEISDEQLDKIFVMSEKKFKKKETERTKKDNNIKMSGNDAVEGVEHVKRPVWLTTLSTAASIMLIAGIAIGSTVMIRGNRKIINSDSKIPPAVTATTTMVTATADVSSNRNGSSVTTTSTSAASTDTSADTSVTETVTAVVTKEISDTDFIKAFTGKWTYQVSSINNLDAADTVENKAIVEIRSDASYTYTDISGNVSTGTITKAIEEIGGSKLLRLDFSGDTFIGHGAYYTETAPDEVHFGNGYAARLVRGELSLTAKSSARNWKTAYREYLNAIKESSDYNSMYAWDIQDLNNDGTPELLISNGEAHFSRVNGYYYAEDGYPGFICNTEGTLVYLGEYGTISFCKDENLIGWANTHMGNSYTVMYKYDHGLKKIQSTADRKSVV